MAIEEGNSVELLRISDLYLTRLIIHVKKILCPENEAAASFSGQPTIMSKSKNKIINVTNLVLTVADKVLLGLWDMFDDVSYGQIHPRLVLAVGARRAREIVAAKERFRQEREYSGPLCR